MKPITQHEKAMQEIAAQRIHLSKLKIWVTIYQNKLFGALHNKWLLATYLNELTNKKRFVNHAEKQLAVLNTHYKNRYRS